MDSARRFRRTMVIGVRITLPDYLDLKKKCDAGGISISEYVRAKVSGRGPVPLPALRVILRDAIGE
jgi:hypothetical protein